MRIDWPLLVCLAAAPLMALGFIFLAGWRRIVVMAGVASLPTLLAVGFIAFDLLQTGISAKYRNAALMSMAFILAYNLFFWLPSSLLGLLSGWLTTRKRKA